MAITPPVAIPAQTFTRLNATSVEALTVTNDTRWPISLVATADTTAPTTMDGRIILQPGDTLLSSTLLAAIWPGITPAYVWAWSPRATTLQVGHA